ncbi:MAG: FtsL-like putative cell division protein [Ferruginibacter sp.]
MTESKQILSKFKDWKSLFNNQFIVRNIPFFLFLAGLAVLYIYNGHHADKLIKKISVSEKSIKELQYEYKSVQSEVIFRSKASELIRAVEPLGLKELKDKPTLLGSNKN